MIAGLRAPSSDDGGRLGKAAMIAYQASPRGGVLHVRMAGDRVKLAGRAVTVLDGELRV